MAAPEWFVDRMQTLQVVKGRSRSTIQLAKWAAMLDSKTAPSRPTIGRWLTGETLPPTFEPLEVLVTAVLEQAHSDLTDQRLKAELIRWKLWWSQARDEAGRSEGGDGTKPAVYQGLRPFGRLDAGRFFGRDAKIDELRARLDGLVARPRGPLVILGPSGVGKSSVLAAGLVPAIETRGLPSVPEATGWPSVVLTPGPNPLDALGEAIPELAAVLVDQSGRDAVAVREAIRRHATGAVKGASPTLIVIVDQFEESFQATPEIQRRFAEVLADAATAGEQDDHAPALVLVACRWDFYPNLSQLPSFKSALERPFNLEPLSADELVEIIKKPARRVGITVAPELITRLLDDSGANAGGTIEGELPLISHVLQIMNEAGPMTVAAYERAGGIEGAVAHTADQAWQALRREHLEEAALTLLVRLVRVGEHRGQDTRRPVALQDLLRGGAAEARSALAVLAKARLVTINKDNVQITHEALLRAWHQLRDAVDGVRADLTMCQEIERRARQWDDLDRPDDRLYRGTELAAAGSAAARHGVDHRAQQYLQQACDQARKHSQHQRVVRALTAATIVVILLFAAGLFTLWRVATQRERDAVFANAVAQADRMHGADPSLEAQLDVAAYMMRPTSYLKTRLLQSEGQALSSPLVGHRLAVNGVAMSPDSRYAASASADHTVRIWDANNPQHPQIGATLAGHVTDVDSVAWSPQGGILATGGDDGTIYLWTVADPSRAATLGQIVLPNQGVNGLAFSPDARTLAAATRETGVIALIDITHPEHPTLLGPPQPAFTRDGDATDANAVAFSPDGRTLASADDDGEVRLWDVRNPAHPVPHATSIEHPAGVNSVAWSPDGQILATACGDHMLRLWNVSTPAATVAGLQTAGSGAVLGVAYSPDGQVVATADDDHSVQLWNVSAPTRPVPQGPALLGHTGPVWKVAFRPDGRGLISGSEDGQARLWTLPAVLNGHTSAVTALALGPSGRLLVSGGDDGTVRLWQLEDDRATLLGHPLILGGSVTALTLSRDGGMLAVASADQTLRFWRISHSSDPTPIGAVVHTAEGVTGLAMSPSGRAVATATNGTEVRIYAVSDQHEPNSNAAIQTSALNPTGQPPAPGHIAGAVAAVAWSPDGDLLACAGDDYTVHLLNVRNLTKPSAVGPALTGHIRSVRALAFTNDGSTLASAGDDDSIRLWDTTDPDHARELGQPLRESTSSVLTMAWSPDGHTLASGGRDNQVRLWDTSDREHAQELGAALSAHTDAVLALAVSTPEGTVMASAGRDGSIRRWTMDVNDAIRRICASSANSMTPSKWSQLFPDAPYADPCVPDRGRS